MNEHRVTEVRIDKDSVVVVCECGWTSPTYPTEAEGRADWDIHVGG